MPEPILFTKEEIDELIRLLGTITFSGDRATLRQMIANFDSIEKKLKASLEDKHPETVNSDGKQQPA